MGSASILVCVKDPKFAVRLERALREAGYRVRVVASRADAEELLAKWTPDLILLDVILPESKTAGWELLAEIRRRSSVPIIMVTELSRADDRVRGLREGADDFVSVYEPFPFEELLARIEAVLRRTQPGIGALDLIIDDVRKEVRLEDRTVSLSPKEYRLLKLLASSPGRVFTAREILAELWPGSPYATRQDVQKYVYLLRRKIERDPKNPQLVLTSRGFGYRLAV
jgi:DNA-binding response OmpR family regulator